MAHSTTSNDHSFAQEDFLASIQEEIKYVIWELPVNHPARILSAKTRKHSTPLLTINGNADTTIIEDSIEFYNIKLDEWTYVLNTALALFHPGSKLKLGNTDTSSPTEEVCDFLNTWLDVCKRAPEENGLRAGLFYRDLQFIEWNRPTKDGVRGTEPVKPDIAGIIRLDNNVYPDLWWSPPSSRERKLSTGLPVEVKGRWRQLNICLTILMTTRKSRIPRYPC